MKATLTRMRTKVGMRMEVMTNKITEKEKKLRKKFHTLTPIREAERDEN